MFYDILVEQYRTYEFRLEAANQAEAEQQARELFKAFGPATDQSDQ